MTVQLTFKLTKNTISSTTELEVALAVVVILILAATLYFKALISKRKALNKHFPHTDLAVPVVAENSYNSSVLPDINLNTTPPESNSVYSIPPVADPPNDPNMQYPQTRDDDYHGSH